MKSMMKKVGSKFAAMGSVLTAAFLPMYVHAVADPDVIAAATTATADAADTGKGVYLLILGSLFVIIAVTWAITAARSAKRG